MAKLAAGAYDLVEAFYLGLEMTLFPNVAFVSPNSKKWHAGHLSQFIRQSMLAQYATLLGHDYFVPFGVHPTGEPTFRMVESVLSDLRDGGRANLSNYNPYIGDGKEYGFTNEDLADIAKRAGIRPGREYDNVTVEELAPVVMEHMMDGYMKMISWFVPEEHMNDFRSSRFSTIDTGFGEFVRWMVDEAIKKGIIEVGDADIAVCDHDGHVVDVTGDRNEAKFKLDADAEINKWDLEFLVNSNGRKIINFRSGRLTRTNKDITKITRLDQLVSASGQYIIADVELDGRIIDASWVLDEEQYGYIKAYYQSQEHIQGHDGSKLDLVAKATISGRDLLGDGKFARQYIKSLLPSSNEAPIYLNVPLFQGDVWCKAHGHEAGKLHFESTVDIMVNYVRHREAAKSLAMQMTIDPPSYQSALVESILDTRTKRTLLRPRATTLGTPAHIFLDKDNQRIGYLGEDDAWLQNIESLTDSVIYMIYFPIKKYLSQGRITEQNLTPGYFMYMFMPDGQTPEAKVVSRESGLSVNNLRKMRNETQMTLGYMMNIFGNEHNESHNAFLINFFAGLGLQNIAPKAIISFGMIKNSRGEKLSKDDGTTMVLGNLLDQVGQVVLSVEGIYKSDTLASEIGLDPRKLAADAVRYYLLTDQEQDKNFKWDPGARDSAALRMMDFVRFFYSNTEFIRYGVNQNLGNGHHPIFLDYSEKLVIRDKKDVDMIDLWLDSRMLAQRDALLLEMKTFRTRPASIVVFSNMLEELKTYYRMKSDIAVNYQTSEGYIVNDGIANKQVVSNYLKMIGQLSSMFIPYVASNLISTLHSVSKRYVSDDIGTIPNDQNRDIALESKFYYFGGVNSLEDLSEALLVQVMQNQRNLGGEITNLVQRKIGKYIGDVKADLAPKFLPNSVPKSTLAETIQSNLYEVEIIVGSQIERDLMVNHFDIKTVGDLYITRRQGHVGEMSFGIPLRSSAIGPYGLENVPVRIRYNSKVNGTRVNLKTN